MERFNVYVGYYEVFITTHELSAPLMLSSWHKTADNAACRAEKDWPDAVVFFDEDSLDNMGCSYVYEDCNMGLSNYEPIMVENIKFY